MLIHRMQSAMGQAVAYMTHLACHMWQEVSLPVNIPRSSQPRLETTSAFAHLADLVSDTDLPCAEQQQKARCCIGCNPGRCSFVCCNISLVSVESVISARR